MPDFDERPHAFAYTGGLAAVQGLREIVATAALLPADLGPAVLAGWFDDDALEREVRASAGWTRIRFLGRVTPDEVLDADPRRPLRAWSSTTRSATTWSPTRRRCSSTWPAGCRWSAPTSRSGAQLVGDADCGVTVDPMDPQAVAKAVEALCRDPDEARRLGENGRRAILERYNWENEFAKLDEPVPGGWCDQRRSACW